MLLIARAGQRKRIGAGSSTLDVWMRPAKSDTPRSCSVRPKIVPMLPRSRTRASMKPGQVRRRRVVPERGPHHAVLVATSANITRDLRVGRQPGALHHAVDPDVVAVVAAGEHRRVGDARSARAAARVPSVPHAGRNDVWREPAADGPPFDLDEIAGCSSAHPGTLAGSARRHHELPERPSCTIERSCAPLRRSASPSRGCGPGNHAPPPSCDSARMSAMRVRTGRGRALRRTAQPPRRSDNGQQGGPGTRVRTVIRTAAEYYAPRDSGVQWRRS